MWVNATLQMWHFKKITFQMKWTEEPMNRYLISIHTVSELSLTHARTHKKNETILLNWKCVLRWLGFLFHFQCYKLHNELSWRIMDGNYGRKSALHTYREKNACKFYSMNLNLHNESLVVWQNEKFATKCHISNNWLNFEVMEQKKQ